MPHAGTFGAVLLVSLAACSKDGGSSGASSASPAASTTAPPPARPSSSPSAAGTAAQGPHATSLGIVSCRVVASENGPPPTAFDPTSWITLPEKASITVHLADTGRELRLEGPARARPCAGETSLVTRGKVIGLPSSAGISPGSDIWVGTPCGTVRWGAGVTRIEVGKDGCDVHASLAPANVWLASDMTVKVARDDAGAVTPAQDGKWLRVDPQHDARLTTGGKAAASTETVIQICEASIVRMGGLALATMHAAQPDASAPGGNVGELAAQAAQARQEARAACAVAAARVEVDAGGRDGGAESEASRRVTRALMTLRGEQEGDPTKMTQPAGR